MLCALVPLEGHQLEVLPPFTTPEDVLEQGPLHCVDCALRGWKLYWSSCSYHIKEVNEVATSLASQLVKGDACLVHPSPQQHVLDDLLKSRHWTRARHSGLKSWPDMRSNRMQCGSSSQQQLLRLQTQKQLVGNSTSHARSRCSGSSQRIAAANHTRQRILHSVSSADTRTQQQQQQNSISAIRHLPKSSVKISYAADQQCCDDSLSNSSTSNSCSYTTGPAVASSAACIHQPPPGHQAAADYWTSSPCKREVLHRDITANSHPSATAGPSSSSSAVQLVAPDAVTSTKGFLCDDDSSSSGCQQAVIHKHLEQPGVTRGQTATGTAEWPRSVNVPPTDSNSSDASSPRDQASGAATTQSVTSTSPSCCKMSCSISPVSTTTTTTGAAAPAAVAPSSPSLSSPPTPPQSPPSCSSPPSWEDLSDDLVARVASWLGSSASAVMPVYSTCRSWRRAVLGDDQLLGGLYFHLDMCHPFKQHDDTRAVSAASLQHWQQTAFKQQHPALLERASKLNNVSALICRARLLDAVGVCGDAMRLWRCAAKCGDAEAQLVVGLALYRGTAGLAQDPEEAYMWLNKAMKQVTKSSNASSSCDQCTDSSDNPSCQPQSAVTCQSGVTLSSNSQSLNNASSSRLSALTSRVQAQAGLVLGYLCFDGEGTRTDRSEAVRYFKLATAAGWGKESRDAAQVLGWIWNTGQY